MRYGPYLPLGMLLGVFLFGSPSDARMWNVSPDGGGDAPTVQAAIDSAQAGDEVVLAAGTYTWTSEGASGYSMITMKPGITLRSESGPQDTVLDAEGQGRGILCRDVENDVRIVGLTVENGLGLGRFPDLNSGAGIYSLGVSRPTIENCVIRNNLVTSGGGGGIACDSALIKDCQILGNDANEGSGGGILCGAAQIINCTIRGNESSGHGTFGAGIVSYGGTIVDCLIEANGGYGAFGTAGGGVFAAGSKTTTVRDCLFLNNIAASTIDGAGAGSGICVWTAAEIINCVFIGNRTNGNGGRGGLGTIYSESDAVVLVEGCTFVGNIGETSGATPIGGINLPSGCTIKNTIIASNTGVGCAGAATYSCTNIVGNTAGDNLCGTDAGGNFSAFPQFCAADPTASRSVELQSDSPCAPENHPDGVACGLIGAGEVTCGSTAVEERTWSGMKSLFGR